MIVVRMAGGTPGCRTLAAADIYWPSSPPSSYAMIKLLCSSGDSLKPTTSGPSLQSVNQFLVSKTDYGCFMLSRASGLVSNIANKRAKLAQCINIYDCGILWAQYIRVREPVGTMGAPECAPPCLAASRLLRETQRAAPAHGTMCCAAMCACRHSRVPWLLLGAAGQRSNPSVCCRLPGAVFHLSTPVRPSWCPNHPQSLQLWNYQFHQLQSMTN